MDAPLRKPCGRRDDQPSQPNDFLACRLIQPFNQSRKNTLVAPNPYRNE